MKLRLQIIGVGGMLLTAALIAGGAILLHSDTAILCGGAGFITSTFLKTLGDLLK